MHRALLPSLASLALLLSSTPGGLLADEPALPTPPPPSSASDFDNVLAPETAPPPPAEAPPPSTVTAPLTPPEAAPVPTPAEAPTLKPSAESKPTEAAPPTTAAETSPPKPEPSETPKKATEAAAAAPKPIESPKAAETPTPGPSEIPKKAEAAAAAPAPTPSASPDAAEGIPAEATAAPEPTPSASPTEDEESAPPAAAALEAEPVKESAAAAPSESTLRHHGLIPEYQKTKPQWAIELSASPSGLGSSDISTDFSGNPVAVEGHFEFQPAFLQSIGVLGMGPTVGLYIFPQDQNIATNTGVWTVGWEFRYQARFFREQPIVPVAGFAFERIAYHLMTGSQPSGTVTGDGPIFGLWVLLNVFESRQAETLYKENGVSRSYLTAEARDLEGGDDNLNFSGFSYFFGLRIEF